VPTFSVVVIVTAPADPAATARASTSGATGPTPAGPYRPTPWSTTLVRRALTPTRPLSTVRRWIRAARARIVAQVPPWTVIGQITRGRLVAPAAPG
jgi:hypothetical protein